MEFKTPSWLPTLKKSKSGSSSSGGSSGSSMSSTVTSSFGSTTPYPSSSNTSSGGAGQSSSSLSSSNIDNVQVEATPIPAVRTMPQLETSKEGTYTRTCVRAHVRIHTHICHAYPRT